MKETKKQITARSAAYHSLLRCETQGRYANLELDHAIEKCGLVGAERGLFTTLVYGVIERMLTLDHYLSQCVDRPYHSIEKEVRTILRIGAYQLLYLDRIPEYAVLDESVDFCKKVFPKAAGFVNAVLRSLLRKQSSLTLPDRSKDPIAYLSTRFSVLPALCTLWCEQYGFDRTEALLTSFEKHPPLTLRVNTLKTTREALLQQLQAKGIDAIDTPNVPYGITIRSPLPVSELTELQEGLCYVQDAASQMTAKLVGACPGETVLDACACPGGKSFYLAMEMKNQGTLYSCDLHENKLSLIRSGADRMGITCITTQAQNGEVPCEAFFGRMDRVLCDVPCSGLGVLAKKPDLRYKDPESFSRLPAVQSAILSNCAAYVKDGGTLVYSTCTLNANENEQVIEAFLQVHPEFTVTFSHTFFPDVDGTDGFFACQIKKQHNDRMTE